MVKINNSPSTEASLQVACRPAVDHGCSAAPPRDVCSSCCTRRLPVMISFHCFSWKLLPLSTERLLSSSSPCFVVTSSLFVQVCSLHRFYYLLLCPVSSLFTRCCSHEDCHLPFFAELLSADSQGQHVWSSPRCDSVSLNVFGYC